MRSWEFIEDKATDTYGVYNQDGTQITQKSLSKESCLLITAAPKMLQALKLAISKDQLTGETRDAAVAAIDKAEGK